MRVRQSYPQTGENWLHLICTFSCHKTSDVNNDGVLNIDDVTLVQQFLVKLNHDNFDQILADMNDDGVINIIDATFIQISLLA